MNPLKNCRIRQKIGLGYGVALGVAILGTTVGIVIGNFYQNRAWDQQEHTQEEISLLSQIQANVLQIRTHQQQLIPLLAEPELFQEEYSHIIDHAELLRDNWEQLQDFIEAHQNEQHDMSVYHTAQDQEFHDDLLPEFIETYRETPTQYLETLENQVESIDLQSLNSPEDLETAQDNFLEFTNSEIALQFDGISDELTGLIRDSYIDNQVARVAVQNATTLRITIIIFSMVISVIIAIILVLYTSRTLTRPLLQTTAVAKQVTEESNFQLKADIQTNDEVGTLAASLNQLIERVEQLLQEQKASTEQQLMQSEKMSSLGRMLAGVAHEINNPVNFIYGNIIHIEEQVQDVFDLIHTYEQEIQPIPPAVAEKVEEVDWEFLEEDLPKILNSIKVGAERTRQIVLSLRNFSSLDEEVPNPVNLHDCLESTLLILNNRIKRGVEVVRNYGEIPEVEGYMGSLYQVFMNLLNNALDTLDEKGEDDKKITITTERINTQQVRIGIADNGCGIPPTVKAQIFDNFFTTKPAGVGTGLGLAISQQIVEEKHHGKISCESTEGDGTAFHLVLWIQFPQET
ncbi:MAG: HAMP domain-containing protein [Kamptonema sp. SIO4C4]|nr:HAMP domain-containing protein [Kamptonema sp. SIO4C4]